MPSTEMKIEADAMFEECNTLRWQGPDKLTVTELPHVVFLNNSTKCRTGADAMTYWKYYTGVVSDSLLNSRGNHWNNRLTSLCGCETEFLLIRNTEWPYGVLKLRT